MPGSVVDRAISNLLLELMEPMTLQVALAVEQEVEARVTETDALRRKHVERAQYEAELARRRYMKIDPYVFFAVMWPSGLRCLLVALSRDSTRT